MNVTEKQKEILIRFMNNHPDFGRGRLRYNSENKRKIDELWEKLSAILNTAACGPRKSAKEWAKTWRDWKSNILKKVAKHKTYMTGTGGGSPKHLQLTAIETALIEFLTPDASGFIGIPEGVIEDVMSSSNYNETSDVSYNSEEKETQAIFSNKISKMDSYRIQSPILHKEHAQFENNENVRDSIGSTSLQSCMKQKRQLAESIHPNKISKMDSYRMQSPILHKERAQFENNENVRDSIGSTSLQSCMKQKRQLAESIQPNTQKEKYFDSSLRNMQDICINENKENASEQDETASFSGNIKKHITAKYSEGVKKTRLIASAVDLLEKKSSTSETIKKRILELKEEKLEIIKEQLTIHKGILQQVQNMNSLLSSLREELVGQYLEKEF